MAATARVLAFDNPAHLHALDSRLEVVGFRVKSVSNGAEALMEARTGTYDAILIDVTAEDTSAFEACAAIRSELDLVQPAILFHSAIAPSEKMVLQAYQCGGDAFLTDPVDDQHLKGLLLSSVAIRRATAHRNAGDPIELVLQPGAHVPVAGIYRVAHSSSHKPAGTVALFEGAQLPGCRECEVTYKLERAMPHLYEDEDFRL